MIVNSNPFLSFKYWLPVWLLGSTFAIALLLLLFPSAKWLLSLKDVSIFIFLAININWIRGVKKMPVYILLLIAALGAGAFSLSPAPLLARSASLRQMLMPFILLVVGMQFGKTDAGLKKFKNWICYATIVVSVIGALFYLIPVWDYIPLHAYTKAKNLIPHPNGVPYMFYEPLKGGSVPRMVSTILDPINLGHLLCFTLILAFMEKRLNTASMIFMAMCFIATICKGAFLQLFITIALLVSTIIPWRLQIILWLVGIKIFLFGINHHAGVLMHMQGLFLAVKSASWFGHGLGMVGNQASMYGSPLDLGISDTFIGAILGQVGIVGMIIWLVPFCWIASELKENKPLRFLLIAQLVVAILSENSFNLMSILFLMMTIGATINVKLHNEQKGKPGNN